MKPRRRSRTTRRARTRSLWPIAIALLVIWFLSPRYDLVPLSDGGSMLVRTSRLTGRSERLDGDAGWTAIGPKVSTTAPAFSRGQALALRDPR